MTLTPVRQAAVLLRPGRVVGRQVVAVLRADGHREGEEERGIIPSQVGQKRGDEKSGKGFIRRRSRSWSRSRSQEQQQQPARL